MPSCSRESVLREHSAARVKARTPGDHVTVTYFVAFVAFVAFALTVTPAFAQTERDDELNRWVPAGGLEVSIFGHTGKGTIRGTDIVGPRLNPGPGITFPVSFQRGDIGFGPSDVNSNGIIPTPLGTREDIISALVGGSFEIMSPQILDLPSHPRFFLDVNISAVMGSEVLLAPDSNPGPLRLDPDRNPALIIAEASILGRGSLIRVQPQGPQVHAGFGMAFTFDLGGIERIRVKPSVVYSRIRNDLFALTNRPIRTSEETLEDFFLFNNDPGVNPVQDYRLLQFKEERSVIYHGAGLALEVEYEPGYRVGPFGLTLYVKGHGSHLMGDLTTDFVQSNPEFPDEQVFYKYRQDRWIYRVGTGFRLRFLPRHSRK